MTNSETMETNYNRRTQQAIFNELDNIDKVKLNFSARKHVHLNAFIEDVRPLKRQLLEHKAQLKSLSSEKRARFKKAKEFYTLKRYELKKDFRLNRKEMRQSTNLVIHKIETTYKRVLREYEVAVSANVEGALEKKHEFEKAYETYYVNEVAKITAERDQKHSQLMADFNQSMQNNETHYAETIERLNQEYHGNAIKKTNKIKIERREHRQKIKDLKGSIKTLRKARRNSEKADKKALVPLRLDRRNTVKESRIKINDIRKKAKTHYLSLSIEKKKQYRIDQIPIRQDFKMRRKRRRDEFEGRIFKRINTAYIYISPAVFGALFFTVLPFTFMLVASLFRLNLTNLSYSEFRGLDNFVNIFTRDIEFQKAFINTIIYAFVTVVLLSVVTISMAAWLSKNTKINNVVQSMIFTPHIASLVAISILWIAMLNPQGIINQLLAVFGIQGPGWLIQENTSLISVSFVTVWKDIGYYVLIIISGLQAIPVYVYEAAKLDKATKSKTFFKMTLPLLAPTLSFVFVTKFISSFKVFAPIEIMTNGGPMGSSMVLSYWVYKVGRIGFNYGNAMAGAIILTIMIALATLVNYRYFRKQIQY